MGLGSINSKLTKCYGGKKRSCRCGDLHPIFFWSVEQVDAESSPKGPECRSNTGYGGTLNGHDVEKEGASDRE